MKTLLLTLLLVPMMGLGQSKKKQIEVLNFSLDSLNIVLSTIRTNSAKESKELNNSINNLNKEKEKLNSTIESLNVTNDNLTNQTYQLNKKIGVLNNSLDSINNVLSITRENSNQEVKQLNTTIEQLNSEIEALKRDNNISSSSIKTLIKENDKLKMELKALSNIDINLNSFKELAKKPMKANETIYDWLSNFTLISDKTFNVPSDFSTIATSSFKFYKEGVFFCGFYDGWEDFNYELHINIPLLSLLDAKKYTKKFFENMASCMGDGDINLKYEKTVYGTKISWTGGGC